MNKVADVLRAARTKVAQGWTQGAFARDSHGRATSKYGGDAVCWCAMGAVGAAAETLDYKIRLEAYRVLSVAGSRAHQVLTDWNDASDQTQEGVLAGFDRAIALAEEGD